jgi:hypothetical protein
MATVYLAEDLKHRREVAIRGLRPELGHLGPDRFPREVETIFLRHPSPTLLPHFGAVR